MKRCLVIAFISTFNCVLHCQFTDGLAMPAFNPDFMHHIPFASDRDMDDEIDSGNWYEKLHWWKEAKRIYTGDIHDAMEQLKHISSDYETKKQTLLAKVQDKIKILAIEPQAAVTLINGFLADIKTQREKMPDVQNDEQRMAVSRMEEQEKALETLKSDYEQLIALQALLDEAFNEVLVKQVKECENYEERALDYFERIEKVLDDKKAHQYYDTVENSLDNIRALIQYLIGPLALYIDATVGRIEVLVPKMKKRE